MFSSRIKGNLEEDHKLAIVVYISWKKEAHTMSPVLSDRCSDSNTVFSSFYMNIKLHGFIVDLLKPSSKHIKFLLNDVLLFVISD